jgi:DNA-binding MarR family transcriptional regulator
MFSLSEEFIVMRVLINLLMVLSPVIALAQNAGPESELLYYSITGWTNSTSPTENATYAMTHREVQRLLLDIAESPRKRDYVEKALAGSGVSLSDMVANGSLRLEGGRYWLNFSLLTRSDQEIIRRATDRYSQSLADAMLERRAEIESLLKLYDLQGVDPKEIAFAVLGCLSLDWDGLALSTAKGYRAVSPKRKSGEFYFMAEETGGLSLKRIYWGSSNGGYAKYYFTTFGDLSPRVGLSEIRRKGSKATQAMSGEELGKTVGAMMFALREGPSTSAALTKAAQTDVSKVEELLNGMESVGWVARQGEEYRARIPVLTQRDRPMVAGLLRIGHQVMESWLAANYEPFRSAVREITPVRQGVPYQQTFDQLWHYLFGIANQKLVEGGLFADPYAVGRKQQGYAVFLYEDGLNAGW